jgi:hypothetical protein
MFDKIYQCSIADDDIYHQISSSDQFPDALFISDYFVSDYFVSESLRLCSVLFLRV